jgi:hypothetical protein
VLVVVTLYGGNDGLNTVIPAQDPAYQSARAGLAYAADEVLDLGEGLGLNPGMAGLHGLWAGNQLAIVRGVGYPTGSQPLPVDGHLADGLPGQRGDHRLAGPLARRHRDRSAAGGRTGTAASMLAGEKIAAASLPPSGLRLPRDPLGRALALLGRPDPSDGFWQTRTAGSMADLQTASRTLSAAITSQDDEPDPDGQDGQGAPRRAARAAWPASSRR